MSRHVEGITSVSVVGVGLLLSVVSNSVFGRGIGDVSCTFAPKFSPASGAFAIWGPIYVLSLLSIGEQLHSQARPAVNFDDTAANVSFGLAWMFAALWTPAFTRTGRNQRAGLVVAAVCLCLCALSALVAVLSSSAWHHSRRDGLRWITGMAFGLLSGWTLVAAALNVEIAYRANDDKSDAECADSPDGYTIFSPIDPNYATPVPLVLALVVALVAVDLPNPALPIPLIWALFWIRPSYYNYAAVALLLGAEAAAIFRTFA